MNRDFIQRGMTLSEDENLMNPTENFNKLGHLNLESEVISNTFDVLHRTTSLVCCPRTYQSEPINNFESDKSVENVQHLHHTVNEYRDILRKKYKRRPAILGSSFTVREIKIIEADDKDKQIEMLEANLFSQEIIIHQTAKALKCCQSSAYFKFSTELAEYERLLLLSTSRHNGISEKLKLLKHDRCFTENPIERGTINIFNLCLNLKISASSVKHDKLDTWYVILLRCDDIVMASQLCPVLKDENLLKITEKFSFNDLLNKFIIHIEIHCLGLKTDKKLFRRNSKNQDIGLFEAHSTSTIDISKTSEFLLKDSFNLSLDNLKYFSQVEFGSGIIMEFNSSWNIESRVNFGGFVGIGRDVGEYKVWDRKWCLLEDCFLKYWNYPSDKDYQTPLRSIDLRHCTVVQSLNTECPWSRTFILEEIVSLQQKTNETVESVSTPMTIKHFFCADTLQEMSEWCLELNRHLELLQKWRIDLLQKI